MDTKIRVKKISLGGTELIDIRRCRRRDGKPTKSGLSLPPRLVEALIKELQNVDSEESFIN